MAKMGIYSIKNMVTGRTYIGSSKNITARLSGHKKLLRDSKHHNDEMIYDWRRYGEDNFEFKIIEVLYDKDKLLSREEFWIKETICSRVACYNKIIDVGKRSRCYIRIDVSYFSEIRFLIRRNAHAATVLMLFIEHMDDENNVSCTYDFMGRYFSCSRATLHRSIKFLTDEGYISISKIGNINLYTINRQMFSTISLRKCA